MIVVWAFLLALLVCAILWLYPSFQFLRGYEHRLARGTFASPEERKLGEVVLHIYRPPRKNGSTLILVPGLHPDGIYDKRFKSFATSCAETGFYVVAPDLTEFRSFHITNKSVEIVRNTLDAMPELAPAEHRKSIGMLGISYGAGPVFLVAATRKMDYLVSIGGYFNLLHALEFSFTGVHPGSNPRAPHEWGRLIFALNHMDELMQNPDAEILKKSLSLRLQLKEKEAEELEKDLSPSGKEWMQGIRKGLTRQQQDAFLGILHRRKEEAFAVSPESILTKIDPGTRIYLLHGVNDDSVPYEETVELEAGLKTAGITPRTLVTQGLTHVDVKQISRLWDLLKLLHWQRLLLREAS